MLRLMLLLGLTATLTLTVEAAAGFSYRSRGQGGPPASDDCVVPPVYTAPGTNGDTESFWSAVDQSLQDDQCDHPNQADNRYCKRFSFDYPYLVIGYYLKQACTYDFSSPAYLRAIVLQYCLYHSSDEDVDSAYDCSTGCELADNLNQLCQNINSPVPGTTEPATTTTPVSVPSTTEPATTTTPPPCVQSTDQATCGSVITLNSTVRRSFVDFVFPCTGYPRDTDPCTLTCIQEADTNTEMRVSFSFFGVTCDDRVTLYEDSVDGGNAITAASCNHELQGEDIYSFAKAVILQLDLEDGVTSSTGFSYTCAI